MITKTKAAIALCILVSAIACSKQNIKPSSPLQASSGNNSEVSFSIGQQYHGGIIFYIDNTGNHGLIAAMADQGTNVSWRKNKNVVTDATGTSVGSGLSNTQKIVAAQGNSGTYAARVCLNYEAGSFKDWYLPSKKELDLLYAQKNVVGGFAASNYWSSTEASKGKAWDQEFGGGFQFKDNKAFTVNVRAISSF